MATDIYPSEPVEWRVLMEDEPGGRRLVSVMASDSSDARAQAHAKYPDLYILKAVPLPSWDDYGDADELTKRWAAGDR